MAILPTGKPDATPAPPPAADQQHTGNHDRPERERESDGSGGDRAGGGGSRAGAENVEPRR